VAWLELCGLRRVGQRRCKTPGCPVVRFRSNVLQSCTLNPAYLNADSRLWARPSRTSTSSPPASGKSVSFSKSNSISWDSRYNCGKWPTCAAGCRVRFARRPHHPRLSPPRTIDRARLRQTLAGRASDRKLGVASGPGRTSSASPKAWLGNSALAVGVRVPKLLQQPVQSAQRPEGGGAPLGPARRRCAAPVVASAGVPAASLESP